MKKRIKIILMIIIVFTLIFLLSIYLIKHYTYQPESESNMNEFNTEINIKINGVDYEVSLEDNEVTRELYNKLPLEINMKELNGNEKYYYFNSSFKASPVKVQTINRGDIMLYEDNCLVIFYETFNTTYKYTKIGKIKNPDSLKNNIGSNDIKVSFEK